MSSDYRVYIVENTTSAAKPFTLQKRITNMAETDITDICNLSITNAKLLVECGIPWRYGKEPDWEKLEQRLNSMRETIRFLNTLP
jgi:hypothetical protein